MEQANELRLGDGYRSSVNCVAVFLERGRVFHAEERDEIIESLETGFRLGLGDVQIRWRHGEQARLQKLGERRDVDLLANNTFSSVVEPVIICHVEERLDLRMLSQGLAKIIGFLKF